MDLLLHEAHTAAILIARCGAGGGAGLASIAVMLAGAALVGSFAHCAPMCGPFVLMQLAGAQGLQLRRAAAGILPGYHLGRMTTYVALGVVAGVAGQSIGGWQSLQWISRVLLGLAAAAFLLQGLKLALPRLAPRLAPQLGGAPGTWLARLAVTASSGASGCLLSSYRLGLILGLLPCGFLYAALLAAAATGSALGGAAAMIGFAAGTTPALATVGLLGAQAGLRWRASAARLAAPIFLFNALVLAALALGGTT
jgi:sulfite exporter TauE/SafE